jgi:hypothetical protein
MMYCKFVMFLYISLFAVSCLVNSMLLFAEELL